MQKRSIPKAIGLNKALIHTHAALISTDYTRCKRVLFDSQVCDVHVTPCSVAYVAMGFLMYGFVSPDGKSFVNKKQMQKSFVSHDVNMD